MPEIKSKIPEGYEKCYTDDKCDVYYNPKEKETSKAYLKIEVN